MTEHSSQGAALTHNVNSTAYKRDAEQAWNRYLELVSALGAGLNEIHAHHYSIRYWEILLHRFLYPFVCSISRSVNEKNKGYNGRPVSDPAVSQWSANFALTRNTIVPTGVSFGNNQAIHDYLFSIATMSPADFYAIYPIRSGSLQSETSIFAGKGLKPSARGPTGLGQYRPRLSKIRFFIKQKFLRLLLSQKVVFLGSNYLKGLDRVKITRSFWNFFYVDLASDVPKTIRDSEQRLRLFGILKNRGLDPRIVGAICDLLPVTVLELYNSLFNEVWSPRKSTVIITSENATSSFRNDLVLAKSHLAGAKLALVCHGGAFGMWDTDLQDKVYRRIYDYYLGLPFDAPPAGIQLLPLRYLRTTKRKANPSLSRPLRVGVFSTRNHENLYSYDSIFPRVPNPEYARQVEELCVTLSAFCTVRVKDFHGEFRKSENGVICDSFLKHKVSVVDDCTLEEFLGDIDLAVVTYNATVLQELILLEFPFFAYWDTRYTRCNAIGRTFIDRMQENQIFFDSTHSLARAVEKVAKSERNWANWIGSRWRCARMAEELYGDSAAESVALRRARWSLFMHDFIEEKNELI